MSILLLSLWSLFPTYFNDIISTCNLRSVVSDMFFSDDIIMFVMLLVKLAYFIFYRAAWNADEV